MLRSHGASGICVDATYKINDYDFNRITFMVLDDYQEGIPVVWALSNREDKLVLVHILEAIREVSGSIKPSWFMSDMAPQYFNAWEEVFGSNNTKQLWCVWHVDRAWKDGIRRHVHSVTQQKHIYHFLRMLLMKTNIPTFRKLLAQTLTQCRETAPPFAEYFNSRYCRNLEQWALCYRIGTPMNTNMHIESFHRVLKIVYLQHKHNRRVDYLIYILLRIAWDKAFDQLQKLEKGKLTHRICDINKQHKTALSFVSLAVIELVNNNCYSISSQSRPGVIYSIERKENTTPCTCRLKCSYCYACPHIYTCTCLDACTNTTVCKHMHLIQMQQPINTSIQKGENRQTNSNTTTK